MATPAETISYLSDQMSELQNLAPKQKELVRTMYERLRDTAKAAGVPGTLALMTLSCEMLNSVSRTIDKQQESISADKPVILTGASNG